MQSEHAEAHLQALEVDLRNKIEEAKAIARQMKTSLDNDEQYFTTNANGVLVFQKVGASIPIISKLNKLQ